MEQQEHEGKETESGFREKILDLIVEQKLDNEEKASSFFSEVYWTGSACGSGPTYILGKAKEGEAKGEKGGVYLMELDSDGSVVQALKVGHDLCRKSIEFLADYLYVEYRESCGRIFEFESFHKKFAEDKVLEHVEEIEAENKKPKAKRRAKVSKNHSVGELEI